MKERSKKILYLVTESGYFYTHRLPVAKAAQAAGFEVVVAATPGRFVEEIEQAGFRFIAQPFNRGSTNPFTEAWTVRQILSLYRREKPDIVHHVAMQPVVYGSIAARLARVPKVVNAIAGLGYVFTAEDRRARWIRRFITQLFRLLLRRPNVTTIVQNPDDAAVLLSLNVTKEEQIKIILGSGVDLKDYPALPEPKVEPEAETETGSLFTVALASRLLWPKGIGEFVEASRILKKQGRRDIRFLLAGQPDERSATSVTRRDVKQWINQGLIEWLGHVEDIVGLWRQAHVAVLPSSYGEGIPKCLIEAAACGRPLITTDTPGCNVVGVDGETGLLIPPKDGAALAQAILKLADDQKLRQKMGKAARQLVKDKLTSQQVAAETLKIYQADIV